MVRGTANARSLIAAAVLTWVGASCATLEPELALEPGAEKIRLFMSEQRDCKFISEVVGHYIARERWEETDEKARIVLRNEALAKKANAVVILSIDRRKENPESGFAEPASTRIVGGAYQCRRLN